jgi:hypothetical protein
VTERVCQGNVNISVPGQHESFRFYRHLGSPGHLGLARSSINLPRVGRRRGVLGRLGTSSLKNGPAKMRVLLLNSREEDVPDEEVEVQGGADLSRLLAYRDLSLRSLKNLVRILDTARSADYHHSARGRVRHPVMPPDFKNDLGGIRRRRFLPCWTVSSLFFLHLPILMV